MARPRKNGLDYFPFDCDFFSDEKMVTIAGEFGIKGEIVAVKLLCAIYRNGYFALWNDPLKFKLAYCCPSVSPELIDQIVNRLVRWGFFDKTLFDSVRVLTSADIQESYFNAIRKRIPTEDLPYLLHEKVNTSAQTSRKVPENVLVPETMVPTVNNKVSSTKKGVSSAETIVSSAETPKRPVRNASRTKKGVSSAKTPSSLTTELQMDTVLQPRNQSGAETVVSSAETPVNSEKMPQIKEDKIKENKQRKDSQERVLKKDSAAERSGASPTLKEVGEFFIKQGFRSSASLFYNYYQSRGWKTGNAPVADWQALACAWDEREKKSKPESSGIVTTSSLQDQLRKTDERKAREAAEKARKEAIENPDGLSPAEILADFKRKHGLSPDTPAAALYGTSYNP